MERGIVVPHPRMANPPLEHELEMNRCGPRGRRSVATILLVLLAAGCGSGCHRNSSDLIKYETASVSRGNIVRYVTASGSLSAVVSVDVGSQISGIINVLNADFNSPVKKGDVVAEIEPTIYQAVLHQAQADVASSKAGLELSRLTLERKKSLVAQKAATQADLDKAAADYQQAEATVSIKEAVTERAQADLDHCKIVAPVDGIVIARKVDIGQTVAAAMTTPVIFTIAQNITKMHISATVSEADIGQVSNGQTVDFNVDAFPDEVFHGKVVQVRKAPTTTNNVVTYETIIDVDNPEQKLFPGMTADVSILVAQRQNALKISNAALRFTPPDGAKFEKNPAAEGVLARTQRLVYLASANGSALKPALVKVGITNGVDTEIVEGMKEGDRIVTTVLDNGKKSGGPFGGPSKS
jgi:HlyD family secretion protein